MDHYILPKLPYYFDALEPYIDAKTMHLHYEEHHRAYVKKLNSTLEDYTRLRKHVEELLASPHSLPIEIQTEVVHNAGGHANHSLFWTLLTPRQSADIPRGKFSRALDDTFGGFTAFRDKFTEIATEHFSNGWAWLCVDKQGKMEMFSAKDHESPLTRGMVPLLVLDLWEHSYYLKHQNKRPEYINAFWKIVDWDEVAARWDDFQRTGVTSREWRLAS